MTRKYIPAASLLLIFCMMAGCWPHPSNRSMADATLQAPFRHRWWNYYARGLTAAEGRHYAAAMADLKTAIQKRSNDQYMARTYGMHFVDYFPHRELGILLWETQQLDAAQHHLEGSIQQTPTAKAIYYLDRVREERIRKLMQQRKSSLSPPTIRLNAPEAGIHTRDDPVLVSGTASDPNYVSAMTIGDQSVFLNGSKQVVEFRQKLDLPQGLHRISIRAGSLSGMSHEEILNIRIDRRGPLIDIQSVEKSANGANKPYAVRGLITDVSGVSALTINQTVVPIPDGRTVPFQFFLPKKTQTVTIRAADKLGNATHSDFDIEGMTARQRSPRSILLASRKIPDLAGLFSRNADHRAPIIALKGWTASQTVYMDKVVIEGTVKDDRRLAHIFVNQLPFNEAPLTGVLAAFSTSIALVEGRNEISIEATDVSGNRSTQKISILRKRPKANLLNERISVGILPFALHGRVSTISEAFQDVFMHQLAQRNRFQLVDRTLLELILQEHKINRTDLIAPHTTLEMGRLAAADAFIHGSIIETRMGTEVISRFVDTETAEVMTVVNSFAASKKMRQMKQAAEHLALKIHREFPVVDGEILDLTGDKIVTSLGNQQLRSQRRILVVEGQQILHPTTRHPLGHDYKVLGHGRLSNIQQNFSKGRLLNGCDPAVNISHRVMTQ